MRKWNRFCTRCFNDLEDNDIRCRHCGQDYVKLHIRITAIHKKDSPNYKNRNLWLGKTGEFIIDTDYKYVKNSDIEAGWYGGYFIPDESSSETWLHNAIQYIEVQRSLALTSEQETKSTAKQKAARAVYANDVDLWKKKLNIMKVLRTGGVMVGNGCRAGCL